MLGGIVWILFWGFIALFMGLGWGEVDVFGPPYRLGEPRDLRLLAFYGCIASLGLIPAIRGASLLFGFGVRPRWPSLRHETAEFRAVIALLVLATLGVLAIASALRVVITWPSDSPCCSVSDAPGP